MSSVRLAQQSDGIREPAGGGRADDRVWQPAVLRRGVVPGQDRGAGEPRLEHGASALVSGLPELDPAPRGVERGDQRRLRRRDDSKVYSERLQAPADHGRRRVLAMQIHQPDRAGSGSGGMRAVTPIDEERHQPITLGQVRIRQPPRQHLAVGQLAPSAQHLTERNAGGASRSGLPIQVRASGCPGDEPWLRDASRPSQREWEGRGCAGSGAMSSR